MEILQLDGLEPQLFNLIGPLAMNPKVQIGRASCRERV